MEALGKNVVLKAHVPEKSDSLILRVNEDVTNLGSVVSAGEDVYTLGVGDIVLFNGGRKVSVDGVEYIIVTYENVYAITVRSPEPPEEVSFT
jgi:co-chaperonin GroES (HSP10)